MSLHGVIAVVCLALCGPAGAEVAAADADVAAALLAALGATAAPCDERLVAALRGTVLLDCARLDLGLKEFRRVWDRAAARVRSADRKILPLSSHWTRWNKRWRGRYHWVDGLPLLALFDPASGELALARYEVRGLCRERARQTGVVFARGDESEAGSRAPRAIRRVEPEFPERARIGRQAGLVLLWYVVDENGAVRSPCLVAASPHGYGFVEAATEAVTRWSYEPGTVGGSVVAMEVLTELAFEPTSTPLPYTDLLEPFFVEP